MEPLNIEYVENTFLFSKPLLILLIELKINLFYFANNELLQDGERKLLFMDLHFFPPIYFY
jgi:hypothetical protein